MKWTDNTRVELENHELDLLVWNAPNEVLNGFAVERFSERIGVSKEKFHALAERMRSISESGGLVVFSVNESKLFRNALAITMHELGVGEFQTRTGYDLDEGQRMLQELDRFLRGELCISGHR